MANPPACKVGPFFSYAFFRLRFCFGSQDMIFTALRVSTEYPPSGPAPKRKDSGGCLFVRAQAVFSSFASTSMTCWTVITYLGMFVVTSFLFAFWLRLYVPRLV